MAATLLFRRRAPLTVMGVIAALALLQLILTLRAQDPLPFDIAVLIAMYSAVKYGRRLSHAYLAGAVVALGVVIEVARHWLGVSSWMMTVTYVGVCGTVWLTGFTMR